MSNANAEQPEPKEGDKAQADEAVGRTHVERQPVPGHPENIPVDGDMRQAPGASPATGPVAGPVAGPVEENAAPTAEPATQPGVPPGTQSGRDRLRGGR